MQSLEKLLENKLQRQVRRHLQLSTPVMDLQKIITELQAEKHRLDEAIQALERLSSEGTKTKRRGRPPRWLTAQAGGGAADASISENPESARVADSRNH